MRITIVEDSPAYLEGIKNALEDQGHEVAMIWRFQDGLDACIEEIRGTNPELVLLDHYLDVEFDGEYIAARLKDIRLVSISSSKKSYCPKQYSYKDLLVNADPGIRQFAVKELLKYIYPATQNIG